MVRKGHHRSYLGSKMPYRLNFRKLRHGRLGIAGNSLDQQD